MILWKLRRLMATVFFRIGPLGVAAIVMGYLLITYLLMLAAGESEITSPDLFFYWVVVTASTVGYGDYSPVTNAGRWVVLLWAIPVGLGVFALAIARIGFYLSEITSRGRKGLRKLMLDNHTVIIGWNGQRTTRLIQILKHKDNRVDSDIVLCVDQEMENPLPGEIEFVRVENYCDAGTMSRVNLAQASRIIIDTPQDDVTMTTALFCEQQSPASHKTVYFQNEGLADILINHCPNVEVVPSVSIEMLVKSAIDPGSSALHKELLDGADGMTQYSTEYQGQTCSVKEAFFSLREHHDATLIAIKKVNSQKLTINPALDLVVDKGDIIHYVADFRIEALNNLALVGR